MNKSETTTPATSVVESVSSSTRNPTARTGTTTTNVKIAKQRGTSALNSHPTNELMTLDKSNFPTIGSAVLYLNNFHYGEFLDRLNVVSRHDPEWIRNIADITMAFDWESEEEKKRMLKWSIKEKYVMAINS
jgi:uncharacterized protein (DUF2249 family)